MSKDLEQLLGKHPTIGQLKTLYNRVAEQHNTLVLALREAEDISTVRELAAAAALLDTFDVNRKGSSAGSHPKIVQADSRDDAYFARVNASRPEVEYPMVVRRTGKRLIRQLYEGKPVNKWDANPRKITEPAQIQRALARDYSITFVEDSLREMGYLAGSATETLPSIIEAPPQLRAPTPAHPPTTATSEAHEPQSDPHAALFRNYLRSLKHYSPKDRVSVPDSVLDACKAFVKVDTNSREDFIGRMWREPPSYVHRVFSGKEEPTKDQIGNFLRYVLSTASSAATLLGR